MKNIFYFLKLSFLLIFLSCQKMQNRATSSLNIKIDDYIAQLSQKGPLYGNILVKKSGAVLLERSYGLANLEWNLVNTSNSKFNLASVSKQFTAAAIAILVKNKKISYDDLLTSYFPIDKINQKNREHFKKITIKDLLAHRGGLLKDPQPDFINLTRRYNLQELTEILLRDVRLISRPIGDFSYSNIGYTILARIVEIVTKFDFETYLSFKLFKPLNLLNSGIYHRSKIIPNISSGYYRDEDNKFGKFCCYDSSTNMGSHNIFSTAEDLSFWVDELTKQNKLLPNSFLNFQNIPVKDDGTQYFNGLYKEETLFGSHYWHDGFSGGYVSRISFYPEKDLTIIILLNRVNIFTAQLRVDSIHKKLLEQYLE